MKQFCCCAFVVLLALSCKQLPQPAKNKYFEGFVEMNITVSSADSAVRKKALSFYGSRVTAYLKNNFYTRVYSDSQQIILNRELFNPDSLKQYSYNGNADTVFYTDLTIGSYFKTVGLKEIAPRNILNKNCKGILLTEELYMLGNDSPFIFKQAYYFDTTYHLPGDIYKNVKYGSYDEVFGKYPYVAMGIVTYGPFNTKIEMIATRIIQTKMDDTHFMIPNNKVFVRKT